MGYRKKNDGIIETIVSSASAGIRFSVRIIRVRSIHPPGHVRTPHYLRGKVGTVQPNNGLDAVFAEITDLAARCKFRNCTHAHEPGCAVREDASEMSGF